MEFFNGGVVGALGMCSGIMLSNPHRRICGEGRLAGKGIFLLGVGPEVFGSVFSISGEGLCKMLLLEIEGRCC